LLSASDKNAITVKSLLRKRAVALGGSKGLIDKQILRSICQHDRAGSSDSLNENELQLRKHNKSFLKLNQASY
jgi:hypothetical protein